LISHLRTHAYDDRVLPLLHRMSALEKLTISLSTENRTAFIDVTHLNNEIRNRMSNLSTFIFNILTYNVHFSEDNRPSTDDVRRTFIQETSFDCYVDYNRRELGRCHIYSLPLPLTYLHGITNHFPGGQFIHVRFLTVLDIMRPFEHEFFKRINRSFPLLKRLTVFNHLEQKRSQQCLDHEQAIPIVEYSHLTELDLDHAHIDYVEQFLINTRIYMSHLHVIHVQYEHLTTVTKNFTNDAARLNCAKVKRVFTKEVMVHSQDFHVYFPSFFK
jgi:hypothetical protein